MSKLGEEDKSPKKDPENSKKRRTIRGEYLVVLTNLDKSRRY